MTHHDQNPPAPGVNRRGFLRIGVLTGGTIAVSSVLSPTAGAATPSAVPTLAVACTPEELAERQRALDEARRIYRWSENTPNVEGVPMVADLPTGENPSVEWMLEFIRQALELVENFLFSGIQAMFPQAAPQLVPLEATLKQLKNQHMDAVDRYEKLVAKYADATVDTVIDEADRRTVEFLSDIAMTLSTGLRLLRRSLFDIAESTIRDNRLWFGDIGTREYLHMYDQMWSSTEIPPVSRRLHDDAFFGYTRVAGPNPMVLRRMDSIPSALRLDPERTRAAAGEDLDVAIAQGRAYICDYEILGGMAREDATYKLLTGPGYNTAPIAVFVRPADSGDILPVAIQVGQRPGESPVYYAQHGDVEAPDYWGWEMAKTVVQTADFNHHEMFSHLASTHLVSEAFCIATHRQLPPGHPLRSLLEPHFEGDLYINNLAASIIMGPETFADLILAPAIDEQKAGTGRARLNWDFSAQIPRTEIRERGLDDPALTFPYRDDALTVWDDIQSWVSDYVRIYYADDSAVRDDTDLANWLTELSTVGRVRGIPRVADRETLTETLTMVIFTASAQHAAVNYLQRDQMAYVPFMPGAISAVPTDASARYTAHDWFQMFPGFLASFAQVYFLNVLGTVYYRRLGDYRTGEFPHPESLVDPRAREALERFQERLRRTETVIEQRNTTRTMSYPYLLPSNIPMSTNI